MLLRVSGRERASEGLGLEDDKSKMKEQSWCLSSFTVGCSYSIKPWMALSVAAPAKRPAQPGSCHRLPLMFAGREGEGEGEGKEKEGGGMKRE